MCHWQNQSLGIGFVLISVGLIKASFIQFGTSNFSCLFTSTFRSSKMPFDQRPGDYASCCWDYSAVINLAWNCDKCFTFREKICLRAMATDSVLLQCSWWQSFQFLVYTGPFKPNPILHEVSLTFFLLLTLELHFRTWMLCFDTPNIL
jgi:hypothetical protein